MSDWHCLVRRYHGGWLAPNIYYLGHAGSVIVNGIRISGASGIYKSHDFHKGRFLLTCRLLLVWSELTEM